jgi:nitrogenase molybdenum-iron protein NifN
VFITRFNPELSRFSHGWFPRNSIGSFQHWLRAQAPVIKLISSGFVSPADPPPLKELFNAIRTKIHAFPRYSDTLDNPHWKDYQLIPEGGTSVEEIRQSGTGLASIEFGTIMNKVVSATRNNTNGKPNTAGEWLEKKFHVPLTRMNMPIGIDATDKFINFLEDISGKEIPEEIKRERGRLIDAYVDGHKYAFGKRAIVYGEEDLVLAWSLS